MNARNGFEEERGFDRFPQFRQLLMNDFFKGIKTLLLKAQVRFSLEGCPNSPLLGLNLKTTVPYEKQQP